ncbi:hypothetical protein MKZ38_008426 [Zalerion maritima]|uniref:Uncharacterized protein n=1 Tax=Zalerion maritima TaxID=339359 RepID=A0AAD5RHK4_9PEZI|nr:hypothetical protein MKZ38_008426 [Zalerion maritima]
MSSPVRTFLEQHPTNPVGETGYTSSSHKNWARDFASINKLYVHSFLKDDGGVGAKFENAFLDLEWRLAYEEDGINWFHTEVSNIVLAAWARYPAVIQTSHEKPLTKTQVSESVNIAYSVRRDNSRLHIAIGEFKRCLLVPHEWQQGTLRPPQQGFSRELRGYAYLYRCPQIFCFDNSTFLMLQFRATTAESIRDPDCAVDCWVFPRDNFNGLPLRWALYRLLVQGFRRCQGIWSLTPSLYNTISDRREFYNGRPLWRIGGQLYNKPWGHCRRVDPFYGAFYWTDAEGCEPQVDVAGDKIWDTLGFWEPETEQGTTFSL